MRRLMEKMGLPLALAALVAAAVVLTGCPTEEPTPPPEEIVEVPAEEELVDETPIKIGGIFDTTGAASALGEPEANTAMMLEEQINKEGGVDGRPLEILIRDTKGQETEGLTVTKELIDREEVVAIVGPSRSGTTMAIIEEIQSAEIPLMSCAAARAITEPTKEWVFNTPQSDEDAVTKIYDYLQGEDINKVAIITASSGFGQQGLLQLEKLAPEMDIEIVTKEEFADTDKDITAQLTKIKASDAEAMICWGVGPAPSLIARQHVE